jgi:hypothetical protein
VAPATSSTMRKIMTSFFKSRLRWVAGKNGHYR